jgi:hypothetical protein
MAELHAGRWPRCVVKPNSMRTATNKHEGKGFKIEFSTVERSGRR